MRGEVLFKEEGPIGIATLNYPERRNALSDDMIEGLIGALDWLEQGATLRVLIVTGTDPVFCSGADVSEHSQNVPGIRRYQHMMKFRFFNGFERASRPIITAVNGHAVGGGFELLLLSDLVVASEKAEFFTPEPKLGVIPGLCAMRLQDFVGPHRAKEIMLAGARITAQQAFDWGIVNRVVEREKVLDEAKVLAGNILERAPLSIEVMKSMLNRDAIGSEIAHSIEASRFLFNTEDRKEGGAAFREKRTPNWKGE